MDETEGLIKRHEAFEKLLSSQEDKVSSASVLSPSLCCDVVLQLTIINIIRNVLSVDLKLSKNSKNMTFLESKLMLSNIF